MHRGVCGIRQRAAHCLLKSLSEIRYPFVSAQSPALESLDRVVPLVYDNNYRGSELYNFPHEPLVQIGHPLHGVYYKQHDIACRYRLAGAHRRQVIEGRIRLSVQFQSGGVKEPELHFKALFGDCVDVEFYAVAGRARHAAYD